MNNENNKVFMHLPCMGFYNSLWDDATDIAHDDEIAWLHEEYALTRNEAADIVYESCEWDAMREVIAKKYVALFRDELRNWLYLDATPAMQFEKIVSPAEYNFETDRIGVLLDEPTARQLHKLLIRRADVQLAIRDMMTPYDGFIPFYPDNPRADEWTVFDKLKAPQWEVLFAPFYEHLQSTKEVEMNDCGYGGVDNWEWAYDKSTLKPRYS